MLSTEEEMVVQRARIVANATFEVGARYIREAEVATLASGFHILDQEVKNGD